jgi:catechol 2,3-dioxygenase-like lactoylglutathione lyase family enzyme
MAMARRTASEASSVAAVFDHVTIRVSDREASERFYATVLRPLGLETRRGEMFTEWASVAQAHEEFPVLRVLRIAFYPASTELVDAFVEVVDRDR